MSGINQLNSETSGEDTRSPCFQAHVRSVNNRQKKSQHASKSVENMDRPTSLFGSNSDQGTSQRDGNALNDPLNKFNTGEPEYSSSDEFSNAAISRIGDWQQKQNVQRERATQNILASILIVIPRVNPLYGHVKFSNKFSYNSNNWGFPSFMEWSEIINPERGFIRSDRVVVEAHIIVQKVVGVRKNPIFDFTANQPHVSDGILVIDGVRLHISKAYLALYSPVFHAMFFSKFSEREMREIPVEDVIYEEFVELLNVVYPSHKPITSDNVEFLLELGDKFEIQYVLDACEQFLQVTNEIQVVTKLVWADQYSLAKLQDVCIRTFKTTSDVKALKQTEEYRNLSDTTKAALLEKIFKLMS